MCFWFWCLPFARPSRGVRSPHALPGSQLARTREPHVPDPGCRVCLCSAPRRPLGPAGPCGPACLLSLSCRLGPASSPGLPSTGGRQHSRFLGGELGQCQPHSEDTGKFSGNKTTPSSRGRGALWNSSPLKDLPSLISLFHLPESPPLDLPFFFFPQPPLLAIHH